MIVYTDEQGSQYESSVVYINIEHELYRYIHAGIYTQRWLFLAVRRDCPAVIAFSLLRLNWLFA